jgi:hypothetical protein
MRSAWDFAGIGPKVNQIWGGGAVMGASHFFWSFPNRNPNRNRFRAID